VSSLSGLKRGSSICFGGSSGIIKDSKNVNTDPDLDRVLSLFSEVAEFVKSCSVKLSETKK
jgi:hypothetical protein